LSISYLPAAKTTSTNLDMPWNILENITSLFKCLAIFIVLISMLHVYGNLYSHVLFIVNRRILSEGLNVIFHQKWSESHVTGTWLWSSPVKLAVLL
jgi:hypothetical protein